MFIRTGLSQNVWNDRGLDSIRIDGLNLVMYNCAAYMQRNESINSVSYHVDLSSSLLES